MEGKLIKGRLQFNSTRDGVEFIHDENGNIMFFEGGNKNVNKDSLYFCGIDHYDKDSKSQSKGFMGTIKK